MKIRSDYVQAPSEEQKKVKKQTPENNGAFGDLLAQEMGKGSGKAESAAAPPPLLGVNPLLNIPAPEAQKPSAEQAVMEQMDNLLGEWENYADRLDAPGQEGNLREAYGVLSKIGSEVERLKEEMPDMAQASPGLKSLVDELEILTVTETYKFNRGDYI